MFSVSYSLRDGQLLLKQLARAKDIKFHVSHRLMHSGCFVLCSRAELAHRGHLNRIAWGSVWDRCNACHSHVWALRWSSPRLSCVVSYRLKYSVLVCFTQVDMIHLELFWHLASPSKKQNLQHAGFGEETCIFGLVLVHRCTWTHWFPFYRWRFNDQLQNSHGRYGKNLSTVKIKSLFLSFLLTKISGITCLVHSMSIRI